MTASADANLRAAWRADPGTARLLAAAGAAQQVWAARAGAQADPAAPGAAGAAGPGGSSAVPADSGNDDAGPAAGRDAPKCPDTEAAPDAAAALKAAIDAEFGAAYAYEVALAQDPPGAALREEWGKRIAEHQSRGTDAVGYLSDLCLPAVAPVAAYRLDAGFLRDPAAGLPALEQRFPAVYADLVALSEGSLRSWAIDRLAAVTGELYLQADAVPAAPGLDAVPDDLPWN
ncbi:ferritin-like domain-containing protein [Arthrobacter zhaoxinii]|uniref:Ferritin-like domain-containing protein n=1 Tax=Arthrobacter zhaoxinii TaxID=2964616 RepID=A0ABY5YU73_9MICC|nr:ferritin-like domain-containing protein [Arthrobacter zhaoxinii]